MLRSNLHKRVSTPHTFGVTKGGKERKMKKYIILLGTKRYIVGGRPSAKLRYHTYNE